LHNCVVHRLALLGALVVVATTLVSPTPASGRDIAARASLEVVSLDPLRVRGERFRAGERVRLTASIDGRRTVVWSRAGRRGRFVLSFGSTGDGGICSLRLSALGRAGSRAELALDHFVCPSSTS
jgi:hypothetical protein